MGNNYSLIGAASGAVVGFLVGLATRDEFFGVKVPLGIAFSDNPFDRQLGIEQWTHCLLYAGIGLVVAGGIGFFLDQNPSTVTSTNAGDATAQAPSGSKGYDRQKWQALREVDPDIRAAYERILPLGPAAVDNLATKYLALNDKNYLDRLVENVEIEAQEAKVHRERLFANGLQLEKAAASIRDAYRARDGIVVSFADKAVFLGDDGSVEEYSDLSTFRKAKRDTGSWMDEFTVDDRLSYIRKLIDAGYLSA